MLRHVAILPGPKGAEFPCHISVMNEQEMQFADPDWQPTGPLSTQQAHAVVNAPTPVSVAGPVNNQAYDAHQPASLPAYDQGYQGAWQEQQFSAQPLTQQASYRSVGATRGHRGWLVWVIIAIVFISMMGGMSHSFSRSHAGFNNAGSQQEMPAPNKQIYGLQGATQVDISDLSGSITVQVTNDNSQGVVVNTDDGSQPQVDYQGQSMSIASNDSGNITVLVPLSVALNLSTGANDIEVDGFSGQLTAQTNSGQITLNNDNLSQGSTLNTNSGNVEMGSQSTVSNTSITSSTGQITLDQTNLSGQVTVSTGGNGAISFTNGTLDPQGKYQFTTDSGDIDLTLPQNTSMQMKISQKGGSYSSAFSKSTGSAPQASVGVTTNSGNITIGKQ